MGGPGSGKSVLATQFLIQGLEKDNENAIYVSLDYRKNAFMKDMQNFGWDFTKHENEGKFLFLEGSAVKRMPQTNNSENTYSPDDLTLDDLVDLLKLHIDKIQAKRVVIDSLTFVHKPLLVNVVECSQTAGTELCPQFSRHSFDRVLTGKSVSDQK